MEESLEELGFDPDDYVPDWVDRGTWDSYSWQTRVEIARGERERRRAERNRRAEVDRKYQEQEAYSLTSDKRSPWVEVDCSIEGISESWGQSWADDYAACQESVIHDQLVGPGAIERPFVMHGHSRSASVPTVHQFYDDLYCLGCLGDVGSNPLATPTVDRSRGILVNHVSREKGKKLQLYQDYAGFLQGIVKEQSYIYLGRFMNRSKSGEEFLGAKKSQMLELGGFCVDIDRTETHEHGYYVPEAVMEEVTGALDDNPELMPTYLTLSGTGIQLWYAFGQRIPLLSAKRSPRRFKYEDLLRRLYARFDDLLARAVVHVDMPCATLCHGFRAPGSPAKGGYPTRLFAREGRGRRTWDPLKLSEILGGKLEEYDVGPWDQALHDRVVAGRPKPRERPATEKQLAYLAKLAKMGCVEEIPEGAELTIADADAAIKAAEEVFAQRKERPRGAYVATAKGHQVALRPRDPKLYAYTLRRIRAGESKPGTRYNALVALAGIAWNCKIPKAQLKEDMMAMLALPWAKESGIKSPRPLEKVDVDKALTSYNELGVLRPREQIEWRLGWAYGPAAKRNGRDQRTHLWGDWTDEHGDPAVNVARENRRLHSGRSRRAAAETRRSTSLEKLAGWLRDNPGGSKRKAVEDLHMSFSTASKYWPEACAMAGVDDTRTGTRGRGVGDRR